MSATALPLHRFTSGIECLSQDRLLRLDKLLTLIDDFFKHLTRAPGKIPKIVFRATGIAPELFARFASLFVAPTTMPRPHPSPPRSEKPKRPPLMFLDHPPLCALLPL